MKTKNKSWILDTIRIFCGILLIIIGIAGILLPIVPGLILIFAGLFLLGEKKLKRFFKKMIKNLKN